MGACIDNSLDDGRIAISNLQFPASVNSDSVVRGTASYSATEATIDGLLVRTLSMGLLLNTNVRSTVVFREGGNAFQIDDDNCEFSFEVRILEEVSGAGTLFFRVLDAGVYDGASQDDTLFDSESYNVWISNILEQQVDIN